MNTLYWQPNEPQVSDHHCVRYQGSDGLWETADCQDTAAYICELGKLGSLQSRNQQLLTGFRDKLQEIILQKYRYWDTVLYALQA